MPDVPTHRLGDLQLQIMKILWSIGSASVAEVHDHLSGGLAYTTIATMLRKMEQRGLVRHRQQKRRFYYEAAVSQADVTRGMANELVDRLFEGSLAETVHHLLSTREVSVEELDCVEKLVEAKRRKQS